MGVAVSVGVGVAVSVGVGVGVGVGIGEGEGVEVGVDVGAGVGVPVETAIAVGAGVAVGIGVGVGVAGVGVADGVGAGDEVGVGGGAVPNATPDNCTFWGLAAASLVSINAPVILLPFEFLAAGGLNVTETSQVPPAARVPRQLLSAVNPDSGVMLLMSSATGFLLLNVTNCGALKVPR